MITPRRGGWLQRIVVGGFMACGLAVAGCAPKLDPQEYGQVVSELPKVQGADKPYRLPQLDEPATGKESRK